MKTGKVPEAVLIRSILKQIHHRRPEVLVGPGVGQDCAAVEVKAGEALVLSSDPITGTANEVGSLGILVTTNDIAAAGADPIGVILTLLLPDGYEESELKRLMQDAEAAAQSIGVEIIGGHTEMTDAVIRPVITVTGVGKIPKDRLFTLKTIRPGDAIIVTKSIALEAAAILAADHEEELKAHFPADFVERVKGFKSELSILTEARAAMTGPVSTMHDVTEGGIFGALWEIGAGAGLGLEADIKKIPVRQETIEICEYFGIDPYRSMSSGSLIIMTPDEEAVLDALDRAGCPAALIGHMTEGNDRIVRNGREVRYLDKPGIDELYRVSRLPGQDPE